MFMPFLEGEIRGETAYKAWLRVHQSGTHEELRIEPALKHALLLFREPKLHGDLLRSIKRSYILAPLCN
jgi:hypothetical protein